MKVKMTIEVPIAAMAKFAKFCDDHLIEMKSAEFAHKKKSKVFLTEAQAAELKKLKGKLSMDEAATKFNVSKATVSRLWQK